MKRILSMCCLMLIVINGCIGVPPTQKGVKEDQETRAIYTVEEKTEFTPLHASLTVIVIGAFIVMLMNHSQSCTVTPAAVAGC